MGEKTMDRTELLDKLHDIVSTMEDEELARLVDVLEHGRDLLLMPTTD